VPERWRQGAASPGARRRVEGRAHGPFSFEVAYIPAGRFVMGSPAEDPDRWEDERQHEVTLTAAFELGVVPVTQALYEAVLGTNPACFRDLRRPVENVSWFDAVSLCNALSAALGLGAAYAVCAAPDAPDVQWRRSAAGFRLPTEAEWEWAARAGCSHKYAGSADVDAVAWTGSDPGVESQPAGLKQANAWGLQDMSGNVWEWCWDWFRAYGGPCTDPDGDRSGPHRVIRGGSWFDLPRFARVSNRDRSLPDIRDHHLGLRVARTVG